jgi:RimJ/RimL family protein N-acetyltransferase
VSAIRPEPGVLQGRFIRLEPLEQHDLPDLYEAIGHPVVYAGGYGGGPAGLPGTREEFVARALVSHDWGAGNVYAVRVSGGAHDGVLVGTTTLSDFDETNEHAHIGWTAYDPRVWATQVNPEAKLLLLGLAFDSGFGRVKIQTDVMNDRSRAAILKLGAKYEGITRRAKLRADGTWRDTVAYSILVDEWPGVRAGIEARLAVWGDRPVEFRD